MFPSKAPFITAEIEHRIRLGFYHEKLPPNVALQNEFLVARQTLTEALRPLFAMGIISSESARGGIRIHPENLTHGVIAVVSGSGYSKDEDNLSLVMRLDGFSVLKIRKGKEENPFCCGLPSRLRGAIFISSALDKPTAVFLREKGIPFISCNIVSFLPGIPYIEYDNPALYRLLMERLIRKGYRRISFFKASHLEGYNEQAGKHIRKLKKEFGLPIEIQDRFNSRPEDSLTFSLDRYISCFRGRNLPPEVLITDLNVAPQFRQICSSGNIGFPESMIFLYHRLRS